MTRRRCGTPARAARARSRCSRARCVARAEAIHDAVAIAQVRQRSADRGRTNAASATARGSPNRSMLARAGATSAQGRCPTPEGVRSRQRSRIRRQRWIPAGASRSAGWLARLPAGHSGKSRPPGQSAIALRRRRRCVSARRNVSRTSRCGRRCGRPRGRNRSALPIDRPGCGSTPAGSLRWLFRRSRWCLVDVTGRSVFGRAVRHGTPRKVVSSCTPAGVGDHEGGLRSASRRQSK